MARYPRLIDGEGVELRPNKRIKGAFELLRFMCCDCGLVHLISFAIEKNGNLGIAMERHPRATASARKAIKRNKFS